MKTTKALIVLMFFFVTSIPSFACEASKYSAGGGGIVLTLQPGVPQEIEWDMTGCWFGIQNWTVYATQPRACPQCVQKLLHQNTPLEMHLLNVTTGVQATEFNGFIRYGNTVSLCLMRLTLLLDADAKKPLAVEITTTGGFGGPP